MARKLNSEESENFHELIAEADLCGAADFETLSSRLREKSQTKLDLSAELGFPFGDDVSSLPRT